MSKVCLACTSCFVCLWNHSLGLTHWSWWVDHENTLTGLFSEDIYRNTPDRTRGAFERIIKIEAVKSCRSHIWSLEYRSSSKSTESYITHNSTTTRYFIRKCSPSQTGSFLRKMLRKLIWRHFMCTNWCSVPFKCNFSFYCHLSCN